MNWLFQRLKSINYKRLSSKIGEDDILEMSASLAFYTALSLAPLLVLLLTFISLINESFQEQLLLQIQGLIGSEASKLIREIAKNVDKQPKVRDLAGVLGLVTLLLSAGAIFGDLRHSLNRIFQVTLEQKSEKGGSFVTGVWGFLKEKLFSMGMVLTFVFISIVSLMVSSVLSLYLKGSDQVVGQVVNFIVSLCIFWILFSTIYFFIPQRDVSKKVAATSGLITAILFSIGKTLIGLYLGQSAAASLYGAAGSFIVLLMWVYYSSAIIYFSAELAHEINNKETKS
ncbi:YihY/virulence factor BrkB family protein [Bdellovibrio sp. BCCA]|uniref:YihY/virulence factor BrkB family protein n=1 Tax=Bdellovibrio sp. BCCA TaxID=3136281 RepID=UPI0030F02224